METGRIKELFVLGLYNTTPDPIEFVGGRTLTWEPPLTPMSEVILFSDCGVHPRPFEVRLLRVVEGPDVCRFLCLKRLLVR